MDKNSNVYVFGFAAIMTLIVAISLASISQGLKPLKEANALLYKKNEILSGVIDDIDKKSNEEVETLFEERIEAVVLNAKGELIKDESVTALDIDLAKEKKKEVSKRLLPLYVYKNDGKTKYIVPVRGKGLWDAIWGYITVEDDINTIAGVSFGHAGETPGLGAEIKDNAKWKGQYIGKKLMNDKGEFVGVSAVKGGIKDKDHQVDAISGATITGDGVTDMIVEDITNYMAYFKTLKNN